PSLLAERNEVLALHVEFARQREDADFVVRQAELPCDYPDIGSPPAIDGDGGAHSVRHLHSNQVAYSEKRFLPLPPAQRGCLVDGARAAQVHAGPPGASVGACGCSGGGATSVTGAGGSATS